MSYTPDVHDQAYQFFIEEVPELLQSIESGLFALTQEFSHNNIHEVMRAAHSIKGGAAMVELDAIKSIAHRLEDSFRALFNDQVEWDADLENLLFQGFDCLRSPLLDQIDMGQFDSETALANADMVFQNLETRLGDALAQAENYVPSSSNSGFDMVASIFEVDVLQGIERLATVVEHPEEFEVAGELRAQAEVFMGFADLFKLPGFGAIAATTITASERHPDQVLDIMRLAIGDFQASRQIVLGGDRQNGGTPCARLIDLAGGLQETLSESLTSDFADGEVFEEGEVFEGGEVFEEGEIFEGGEVFEEGEVFEGGEVFEEGEVFEGGEVFEEGEVFEGGEVFEEGEVFEGSEVFEEGEVFEGSEVFEEGEVFEGGEVFEEGEVFETVTTAPLTDSAVDQAISSQSSPIVPTPESVVPSKPTRTPKVVPSTSTSLSVRVDMDRLERMSNVVSELTINRNSLAAQNEGLQRTVRELTERVEKLSAVIRDVQIVRAKMASILPMATTVKNGVPNDQDEKSGEQGGPEQGSAVLEQETEDNATFDPLEMDRYSVLDSYFQDMLESAAQIEESVSDIDLFAKQSSQDLLKQRQMLRQNRDEIMWARMFPIGNVLNRFPRMVRDLSSTYKKQVGIKLLGVGVLIDKAILEKLYDPLFHLIRNAFAHGIETIEERQSANKPTQGTIEVEAYHQGNETVIEIKDDGKGIDLQAIAQKAIAQGRVTPTEVVTWEESQLTELIFAPGFSTTEQADELSGRGVGLDVVRSRIQELKGSLNLDTELGKGTVFTLRLPFTLTLAKLLIATTKTSMLAFYSDSIEEIVVPQPDNLKESGGKRFLYRGEQLIPIYHLSDLVQYNCVQPIRGSSESLRPVKTPKEWAHPLLLLKRGQQLVALEINQLVTEQELVIKPFGAAIASPTYSYGCTVFSDGTLIPVVDGLALIEYATGDPKDTGVSIVSQTPDEPGEASGAIVAPTILVVDDSTAFRRTLALSLEKAGYLVVQARDGQEGIEQLKTRSDIRLVICDVEMPNMNGFEFLGQRRSDEKMSAIPVAMLTSRSNDKHRQLATQLGANHYFTKPYIAREFLSTIASLIEG